MVLPVYTVKAHWVGVEVIGLTFLTSALDRGETLASPWPLYLREKLPVPSRQHYLCAGPSSNSLVTVLTAVTAP